MASEKTCFRCLLVKPIDEFYRHPMMADGHLNKCKECTKKDVRSSRLSNIDHYREYDRERGRLQHRVALNVEVTARRRKAHPEKMRAHSAVNRAVREGRLIKQPCLVCGDPKSHGHHEDYGRQLDVIWLCAVHHKQRHAEMERNG